ncbi:hypothetical protein KO481_35530 [Nocardia sp. NEAU-G5]|uniref:Uncharacterized protein n=1 Tax=Nocardia albiluteola TaxID=2842303 RepID=A0ABS6B9J7_9NOCA|nr:hypothetical protein [Nocardia albiluteola]MBU3066818.1 hypothetical protein [Nocardia albiluteola]
MGGAKGRSGSGSSGVSNPDWWADPTGPSSDGAQTMGPSGYLLAGQQLRNNGNTLTYQSDGQLVLADKNGLVLKTWDPTLAAGVDPSELAGTALRMGTDGSLYITWALSKSVLATVPDVGTVKGGTPLLSLGKDGSLGIDFKETGASSTLYSPFAFPLDHPPQASKALAAVITAGEQAIADLADPLRLNDPKAAPDVQSLLVKAGLFDDKDHSAMNASYASNVKSLQDVMAQLAGDDDTTSSDVGKLPDIITKGLGEIKSAVDDLNDKLKAASTAFVSAAKSQQQSNMFLAPGASAKPKTYPPYVTPNSDPNKFSTSVPLPQRRLSQSWDQPPRRR